MSDDDEGDFQYVKRRKLTNFGSLAETAGGSAKKGGDADPLDEGCFGEDNPNIERSNDYIPLEIEDVMT